MSPATVTGSGPNPDQGTILAPRIWVPLGVLLLGLACLLLNVWAAALISVFGLFLLVQSQILRHNHHFHSDQCHHRHQHTS